ncbi:hypothetical protein C8R21_12046 [Nitrosospira multiformis]|uniref:Formylmethanofuran dehydrogenase subunit E domain-containing protein n=1 Tax=Nitrosospira multiformis TaxID=1231 RepID=A0A2T5I873_9PROT|nr:hypothetical protein [Nitrosospira multiformis]PTQ80007.1 hypothetical protein C8R21_12046 [Nitrosospira multiformis]
MHFPDFYEKAPVIRTRDPFAAMLGAARDGVLEYRYVDAVRLAGHSCPTVAGAFLVGRAALAALYPDEPAERGNIAVYMPAPEQEGVTGVMAQVLTLLTALRLATVFMAFADNSDARVCSLSRSNGKGRRLTSNASIRVQAWQCISTSRRCRRIPLKESG